VGAFQAAIEIVGAPCENIARRPGHRRFREDYLYRVSRVIRLSVIECQERYEETSYKTLVMSDNRRIGDRTRIGQRQTGRDPSQHAASRGQGAEPQRSSYPGDQGSHAWRSAGDVERKPRLRARVEERGPSSHRL